MSVCVVTPHVTPSHSPGSLTHYVGVLLRLDIFLKIVWIKIEWRIMKAYLQRIEYSS